MKWNLRTLAALVFFVFLISLFFLSHVYACLTVAFVLAYLLDPLVEKLESWGVRREWGIPVTLIVLFSAFGLVGMAILPKLLSQGHELLLRLPKVYHGVTTRLAPWSQQYLGYNVFTDIDAFVEGLGDPSTFVKPIGGLVQGVFTQTFKIVTTILGFLIIPLMTYYLLREYPKLYERFLYLVPKRHHKLVADVRNRLHAVLGGFIRGQMVVSSILSLYYGLAFTVLRLDLSLLLGLMAGFFNVVPYLGILSVLVLTMLIAFLHGAPLSKLISVGVVFAFGMGLEGSLLTPRIVGKKVGLSPLTLIIALLVGGELLGLVGMLLAVPIAAISKVFLGVLLERYRNSELFKRV